VGSISDGTFTVRHLNPVRPIDRATFDSPSVEVADALELSRRLHVGRNSPPIAETVTRLLQAVRAHAGIALWQHGEQALANCQRLIDMALHFEVRPRSGRSSKVSRRKRSREKSTKRRSSRRGAKACG